MGKLKHIFDKISVNDEVKQKYFAEKLIESFLLKEGKCVEAYDIDFIEQKIIEEAFKKESLVASLRFVDGIFTQINEGFISSLKSLGKKAWGSIKKTAAKIKDKLASLWNSTSKTIQEWNQKIIKAANRLEGITETLIETEKSYLFEEDEQTKNQSYDDHNPKNKIIEKIVNLFLKKEIQPLKSGLSLSGFKMFKIENDDGKILYFGDDEASLIPMLKYNKAEKSIVVILPKEINNKTFSVLADIITSIKNNELFGLVNVIKNVEPSTNTLTIAIENKNIVGKPGKNIKIKQGKINFVDFSGAEVKQNDDINPTTTDSEELSTNVKLNKESIDIAISSSGIKNNDDGFYDRIGTTSEATWKAFDSFARSNGYRITSILRNTNGDLNSAYPFNQAEYIGYIANMKPFINSLREQEPQPEYNPNDYKVFLNSVLLATDELSRVLNRNIKIEGVNTISKPNKKQNEEISLNVEKVKKYFRANGVTQLDIEQSKKVAQKELMKKLGFDNATAVNNVPLNNEEYENMITILGDKADINKKIEYVDKQFKKRKLNLLNRIFDLAAKKKGLSLSDIS